MVRFNDKKQATELASDDILIMTDVSDSSVDKKVSMGQMANYVSELVDALPEQTGHGGQYLTTDGTEASWVDVDALPEQTGNKGKYLYTDGETAVWRTGYHPPLLSSIWADHILNDIQWLRGDTFSWQSGKVYTGAYNKLLDEYNALKTNLYAWQDTDGNLIYTKINTPVVGTEVYGSATLHLLGTTTAVASDTTTITYGDIVYTRTAVSDKSDVIFTTDDRGVYCVRTASDFKIAPSTQEDTILSLYNSTGVAWYYILDTTNTQFKLPRVSGSVEFDKHGRLIDSYVSGTGGYRIWNDGYCEQWGRVSVPTDSETTVTLPKTYTNTSFNCQATFITIVQGTDNGISCNPTSVNTIKIQNSNSATETVQWQTKGYLASGQYTSINGAIDNYEDYHKYLYFYVGDYTQEAIEQTAGVTTETLNAKADTDLGNLSTAGQAIINFSYDNINRLYEGVNLETKFADEISNYDDVYRWLDARKQAGNYEGMNIGDYFKVHMNAGTIGGYTISAQDFTCRIIGLNTYKGCGDPEIGNMIYIMADEVIDQPIKYNPVDTNNGTSTQANPWLASALYAVLNGVNNYTTSAYGSKAHGANGGAGIISLLPSGLQAVLKQKRDILDSRYSSSGELTGGTTWVWGDKGKLWCPNEIEVYGTQIRSNLCQTSGYWNPESNLSIQFPWFAYNCEHRLKRNSSGARCYWWLSSVAGSSAGSACYVGSRGYAGGDSTSYSSVCSPLGFCI